MSRRVRSNGIALMSREPSSKFLLNFIPFYPTDPPLSFLEKNLPPSHPLVEVFLSSFVASLRGCSIKTVPHPMVHGGFLIWPFKVFFSFFFFAHYGSPVGALSPVSLPVFSAPLLLHIL